jgi:hypothetical protein
MGDDMRAKTLSFAIFLAKLGDMAERVGFEPHTTL